MTDREQIIELARKCGVEFKPLPRDLYCEIWLEQLEAFYNAASEDLIAERDQLLVAGKAREKKLREALENVKIYLQDENGPYYMYRIVYNALEDA